MRHSRDRHGRGPRGPALAPDSPAAGRRPTRRDRFDDLVLAVADAVETLVAPHLPGPVDDVVEYAVEDSPVVPDHWAGEAVPLSSLVPATDGRPARIVLFRRPIEHRCPTRSDLEALLEDLLLGHLADLLGLSPDDLAPD